MTWIISLAHVERRKLRVRAPRGTRCGAKETFASASSFPYTTPVHSLIVHHPSPSRRPYPSSSTSANSRARSGSGYEARERDSDHTFTSRRRADRSLSPRMRRPSSSSVQTNSRPRSQYEPRDDGSSRAYSSAPREVNRIPSPPAWGSQRHTVSFSASHRPGSHRDYRENESYSSAPNRRADRNPSPTRMQYPSSSTRAHSPPGSRHDARETLPSTSARGTRVDRPVLSSVGSSSLPADWRRAPRSHPSERKRPKKKSEDSNAIGRSAASHTVRVRLLFQTLVSVSLTASPEAIAKPPAETENQWQRPRS